MKIKNLLFLTLTFLTLQLSSNPLIKTITRQIVKQSSVRLRYFSCNSEEIRTKAKKYMNIIIKEKLENLAQIIPGKDMYYIN